ncbi:peptidylprolyl isomerase [Dysgonomonas sp. 216]|uniref:peptidylprolyl isomerase n=1 Tax=Dysgonomonas sp. 216 TaxID=2302934 RepID=UPI0013D0A861|nr:peptidylprolyl isomerase [Dysgonomonas sp. 216]NDW18317.1 peptidylprolyl isomerase [Dysgonomonas sp. 216]NDW18685.1 peptidylprolyl isomerase [Dysgonomonas sp. 216]
MKKIFCKVILLSALLMSVNYSETKAQNNVIDEIVWIVGDEAILKSDVENTRLQMQIEGERFDGDPYCIIPEQIAVNKLFLHQAKIDSIDIPAASVTREVERRVNNAIGQVGSREKLEEWLGKSVRDLREEWKEQIREGEIVREVQKKIAGNIRLTPAEIRKYYTSLSQDSLPFIPTSVEVQIITMRPIIPMKEVDAVKNRLREYTDRINKGETSFSSLALLYSEDTESAKKGGELGFIGRAMLAPEYASAAFSLTDPNKISNVVETEYGFHIIQLIERLGDRINTRHILLKPKVPTEEMRKTISRMDSLAIEIRDSKFSFEEAAMYVSSDKDSRNNGGLMVNKKEYSSNAGTSRFEMKDLPQEVARIVDKMKIGDVSTAFSMIDEKGKEVVAIVKLKQRIDGHKANMSDDYQVMKSIVEANKRTEILKKWVQDKIKTTFIRIDSDWVNCDFQYSGWVKDNK